MNKYLKKFTNHSDYQTYITGNNKILPNVSYCEDNNDVHYNPWTWAEEYLTTVALEDGTISFNIWKSMGTDMITSISYSTNNGETWTTTANQDNKSEHLTIDVDVNTGDKVLWKGVATQTGYDDEDDYGDYVGSFFSSDCEFDAKGNIMSLLWGDNFKEKIIIQEEYAFYYLFHDYDDEKTCSIVNAKNLILPATTLTNYCYSGMFYNCTSLVTAPKLPAITLATSCYSNMFGDCTSLVTTPELPAITLANGCYESMFFDCISLTTAPELPATTLTSNCYNGMFTGCTSLTTAPELPATTLAYKCYGNMFSGCTSLTITPTLPATTLANHCYAGMFSNCTSLIITPELPATTLTENCYQSMFSGCTSLTTAPELNVTTLANYCYNSMFTGCTSLTTAPVLPATTLVNYCYAGMFNGCTSLNYIKAMFTTTPVVTYTQYWVKDVAASGTFVKNSSATWDVSGTYGVPSGWTVQTASE